jgi:lysozyme family protein
MLPQPNYSARFLAVIKTLFRIEGGVSNDKDDHGGLTNMGVTQAAYDSWRRKHGLPVQPVTFITPPEATQLYWEDYWTLAQAPQLPAPLDALVFDMAVNSGPSQAKMTLQQTMGMGGTAVDGKIGPKTLGMVASYQSLRLSDEYLDARERFYYDICARDPSQKRFLSGWINRLEGLRKTFGVPRAEAA